MNIRGTIDGQVLTVEQLPMAADTRDYLEAEFTFSPEWDSRAIVT